MWAVDYGYPQLFSPSSGGAGPAVYAAMLLAWSLADFVRHAYFVLLLAGPAVPRWLTWLRYSLFFALYPVGIGAEWFLMRGAARAAGPVSSAVYYFCLALYVPGEFFLGSTTPPGGNMGERILMMPGAVTMYSHMVKQRRKTLYGRSR